MNIPKKRKRPKMNCKPPSVIRSPGHLAWVRKRDCACRGVGFYDCNLGDNNRVEAAHVRTGTDGGTSIKPSDCWVIPLCAAHHRQQHQIGESAFEKQYNINMKELAKTLWDFSPHRIKYERKQQEN